MVACLTNSTTRIIMHWLIDLSRLLMNSVARTAYGCTLIGVWIGGSVSEATASARMFNRDLVNHLSHLIVTKMTVLNYSDPK